MFISFNTFPSSREKNMKLLRNGMLLRENEMQPFRFSFFQELASCNQLHGTMKENNELLCLRWPILSKASLNCKIIFQSRIPPFHYLEPNLISSARLVCSLKIWSWLASFRIATWNFATLVSRDTSAMARTYGRFWARLITWVSASLLISLIEIFHGLFDTRASSW